ncbi:SDR family oxidoreductase [Gluconacetobacter azotocaptans]|uniref:SDR family oxidoreductase n=2 Tax=Gluconacetobacter azotocaptans TaxID=142834 RepID=A0A7W4JPI1_9PROT|nr:SDR family oxidoreductase [Gluconacetobacter azotocaptans]MBB2188422.1 SDR family oxidoreductase [Gluconacetobacter azotocaptans]MBM9400136.1 SDR family oxidoreductase [Gluconacetobacter azotocaptans]GBQ27808.1 short-chain dehydrogenase [Gluconacetobacter azotocaptans DSM 13594]
MPEFPSANVVITGASSGIGQAIAETLARPGAMLVLAARNADALNAIAARCRDAGAQVTVIPTDVTDAAAVQNLAQQARVFAGTIDMWVSNAGVGAVGRFHEVPIRAHEQVVRTNLLGHMNDAHAVLPIFLDQRFGTFVNVISVGGFCAAPYAAAYSASKFGLRGFSEALRGELSGHPHIHICDVYPSFVDTPGISHGANYTGHRLSAPPPLLDARRVAAAIVNLLAHPKDTVMIGSTAWGGRLVHMLAPAMTARIMNRILTRYFATADAAATTDGNLFAPAADEGHIDGGLRSRPRSRGKRQTLAVLTVFMALGLTAFFRRISHASTSTRTPDSDASRETSAEDE